ncbi:hypothetical protein IL306_006813 [Fusarium sp. DS 682]|nr:hypothetical protein IL306_006813 [Fusarium sp. DS 682]
MNTNGDNSKAAISDNQQEYKKVRDSKNEGEDDPDHLWMSRPCKAEIDHLIDIEWNTQAFEDLVLDDQEKRLLVGFVGATKNG